MFVCGLLCFCNNKNAAENNIKTVNENNGYLKNVFDEINKNSALIRQPMEYYRDVVLRHSSSRGYVELLDMMELEYFIPGYLCFVVYWRTGEGYVYKLYTFKTLDNKGYKYRRASPAPAACGGLRGKPRGIKPFGSSLARSCPCKHGRDLAPFVNQQAIAEIYNLNNGWPLPYGKILTEKMPGVRFGDYLIVGDINDDSLNEIMAFSFGGFGNLFTIYGFDITANSIVKYCEIEYYFNYDEPFSPIEFGNDGMRILEIIDKESYDLAWNKYCWNELERRYRRK
jgi:hypothetical protein